MVRCESSRAIAYANALYGIVGSGNMIDKIVCTVSSDGSYAFVQKKAEEESEHITY